ncbi:MAG TPA: beta-CASP ribonuclease aCPSF1 [Euryarchaeota archaeon]|nr:ribonuclease [archaeon BMS3Bbin15]HDL14689.1 beta-CASP ribonuclease aCPSF1 [Euryarchaeota archaeon]
MVMRDILEEIRHAVREHIPEAALVTRVDFEGSEVVLYSKNPSALTVNSDAVKELARVIRKRVIVRPDPSALLQGEDAKKRILEIVPSDAGIVDIKFDIVFGEVIIEAEKPGLVIGKSGSTLNQIRAAIGWVPKVIRAPPIPSKIIKSVRQQLLASSEKRKEILVKIGRKLHRSTRDRETSWIRVSAMGGFREVGRTSMLIQTPESRVLVDCGVNVAAGDSENAYPYLNIPEFNIEQLDAVVITHAHLDHCGFVPYLYYMGYEGPIYCTPPTRDLMFLLHWDFLDVVEREGRELPYPRKYVKEILKYAIPVEYGEVTDIAPDIRLTLHNAGHILGSSIAHFHIGEGLYNLAYTGDIKFERSRLLQPANVRFPRLETLIMESTYGGRRDVQPSRKKAEEFMVKVIKETIQRGGKALIPVFSVGRAQELMLVLEDYANEGILEDIPVYLDGMIWEATSIHTTYPEYLNIGLRNEIFHKGHNPFISEIFNRVTGTANRKEIIEGDPSIILATSGMLAGGPSVEYLRKLGDDSKNSIIFVGYQAEGSLGRRIQKGWKEVPMKENGKTRVVKVNMQVHTVEGFSGHSDRNQLLNYIKRLNPKPERIVTCHGEESKCIELASALHKISRSETRAAMNLEAFRVK